MVKNSSKKMISFLVPVHNEEKIIRKTLNNLVNLNYSKYEVILGLDGCTDKTESIVKEFSEKYSKIFKYFILNERKGKPAVVNKIIKKAKGEIIIINDSDWLISTKYPEGINKIIKIFDKEEIGGIADAYPVEWEKIKIKRGNIGYKMVAYSSYFWINFQKEKLTYTKDKIKYIKEPAMFLTNIFRKKLYKENNTLGDDFERTFDIMKKGYKIVLFEDINLPRMIAVYNSISIKDLFKQKVRTAMARKQVKISREGTSDIFKEGMSNLIFYMCKESLKKGYKILFLVFFWIVLTFIASFVAQFKKIDTKKGWNLRIKR